MSDEKPDAEQPDAQVPEIPEIPAVPEVPERSADVETPAVETEGAETESAETEAAETTEIAEPTTDSLPVVAPSPQPAADDPGTRPVTRRMPVPDLSAEDPAAGRFAPIPGQTGAAPRPTVVRTRPRGGALTKSRGRTIGLIATAVVLLLVIAGVSTELYVRNKVTGCIEDAFTNMTGTSTTVSVPRGPLIGAWFTGSVPWVQVDTNDSPSGTAMRLHARADEVARDGRSVQSLRGTAFIPYERVQEMAGDGSGGQQMSGAEISSITGNADGSMTIEASYPVAFFSVPATVVIKPTQVDGKVEFRVEEAKAFGIGLPNDFAQQMVDQVTDAMLGPLFAEISVDKLEASDRGIDVAFTGQDVNLQAASTATGTGSQCT